ncbi:MAG: hypothetical protein LBM76_00850 [Mycoplasmataceae bacterium]|nr:hypothetical protein [Mycoplasmataceae bacterium]
MLNKLFKKFLCRISPVILLSLVSLPICYAHSHTTGLKSLSQEKIINRLKSSSAESWDSLLSLEQQLENLQTQRYTANYPDWTPEQIAAQVASDNVDFYNTFYKPDSTSDADKDLCFNYLMKFSSDNGFSIISWDFIKANEDLLVDQILSEETTADKDTVTSTLEGVISEGVAKKQNAQYFYDNVINNVIANSTDKKVQKAYLDILVNKFETGVFSEGNAENMNSDDVSAWINSAWSINQLTPGKEPISQDILEKILTYTSQGSGFDYIGSVYNIPFLNDAGISITDVKTVNQKKGFLNYKTIIADGSTCTNDIKLVFTLEDSHGNSVTTDPIDFNFKYTQSECDYIVDSFIKRDLINQELVSTTYNNNMYDASTDAYMPFDGNALSQTDTWYATNGDAANFGYNVGDYLPSDLTNKIYNIPNKTFMGINQDEMTYNTIDEEAATWASKYDMPAGKIVAKVEGINVSIDNPYVDCGLYYIDSFGTEHYIRCDQDPKIYAFQDETCDHGRFSLYWDADSLATLSRANVIASNATVEDAIDSINAVSNTKAIDDINTYSTWLGDYAVAEGLLTTAFATVSATEMYIAAANYAALDIPGGILFTALAAGDLANSVVCGLTAAHASKEADISTADTTAISKLADVAKTTDLLTVLANLQNYIDQFNAPTSFAGFVQSANSIIDTCQDYEINYSTIIQDVLFDLAKEAGFTKDSVDLTPIDGWTDASTAVVYVVSSLSIINGALVVFASASILRELVEAFEPASQMLKTYANSFSDNLKKAQKMIDALPISSDMKNWSSVITSYTNQTTQFTAQIVTDAENNVERLSREITEAARVDELARSSSLAGIILSVIQIGVSVTWDCVKAQVGDRILHDLDLL